MMEFLTIFLRYLHFSLEQAQSVKVTPAGDDYVPLSSAK